MTPQRRRDNWLIIWLSIMLSVVLLAVSNMKFFDATLTWSELIAYVVFVISTLYGGYKFIDWLIFRFKPFNLDFQKQLVWAGSKRPTTKTLSLPLGISTFIVRVQPKRPTIFKRVHLRLLDKPNVNASFPSKETVCLQNIVVHGEGLLSPLEGLKQDHTNGMEGNFQEDWDCASEESLFLEVTVNVVSGYWKGYLMFQAHREDRHRGYGFLRLEVGC